MAQEDLKRGSGNGIVGLLDGVADHVALAAIRLLLSAGFDVP